MKLDSWVLFKAFFNPAAIKTFFFFLLFALFLLIARSIANRYLKKFNPKPLKTSTLAIILVVVMVLMIISWLSLSK